MTVAEREETHKAAKRTLLELVIRRRCPEAAAAARKEVLQAEEAKKKKPDTTKPAEDIPVVYDLTKDTFLLLIFFNFRYFIRHKI